MKTPEFDYKVNFVYYIFKFYRNVEKEISKLACQQKIRYIHQIQQFA